MLVCHFIVSDDVERSRRFYTEVLGGTVVFGPVPTYIALANSFIIINEGGGPTDDKPTVTFEAPVDPDRVSHSMTFRVPDARRAHEVLSARGAQFLAPLAESDWEIRGFFRDPDGHLLEISEAKA